MNIPLAEQLRPKTLDEVVGQEHLVGPNGIIRKLVSSHFLPSIIFWGPPGVGKTTIAHLLAQEVDAYFESRSAVTSGLDDIRKVIAKARERLEKENKRTILFLDEIHRFHKGQQDTLLPHIEKGTIVLIGATTENPSFEVNNALLSRSRVLVLKELNENHLNTLIDRTIKMFHKLISKSDRLLLIELSNGDARQLLTLLEIAIQISSEKTIPKEIIDQKYACKPN
jgi:putative ATPase